MTDCDGLALEERQQVMSEEIKLHQELTRLHSVLTHTRISINKLQQEQDEALKIKHETDSKLEQLSMFLQKAMDSSLGSPLSVIAPMSLASSASSTAPSTPSLSE